MATFREPSAAVLAARARSGAISAGQGARIEWFIENVTNKTKISMRNRMKIAVGFLQSKIVKNISRPVTKGIGSRGGRAVTNRSKSGEYPKADTTQLMKTIFNDVQVRGDIIEGFVGTPLDYGLILETKLNRSFLKRTLEEETKTLTRIMTGPIK